MVRAVNINQTLRTLKDVGYFVYGLDERGEDGVQQSRLAGATVS